MTMEQLDLDALAFDDRGLIPVIAQDVENGQVLMLAWAAEATGEHGAGEILLTSMDRDGTGEGYDLDLLVAVREATGVPVIASGGAGELEHFADGLRVADAVLAASRFHDGDLTIAQVKDHLAEQGIPVRR